MKNFLSYLTFSNLYISIAAGIISGGISQFLQYDYSLVIGLFIFSSTLSVYTFQRLVKFKLEAKRDSELNRWMEKTQLFQIIVILISTIFSIYFYFISLNAFNTTKWWMLISLLLSVMYAVKIKDVNLRDVPYLKMHLISIVWCKALLFPIILNQDYTYSNFTFILGHYFFFIALCIPFDIRDLHYDNKRLKTLPQIMGVKNSKIISLLSIILFICFSLYAYPNLFINVFYWFAILITLIILSFAKEKRNAFYYSVFVDGLILIIGLSYFYK